MSDKPPTEDVIARWHVTWRSAGPQAVAQALLSPGYSGLIDDLSHMTKRTEAQKWLESSDRRAQSSQAWTNRRSWIAIIISAGSLLISALAAFRK